MISAIAREDAAVALACIASTHYTFFDFQPYSRYLKLSDFFSQDSQAYNLAWEAFCAAPIFDLEGNRIPWVEVWAEAEAMVRTGWSP